MLFDPALVSSSKALRVNDAYSVHPVKADLPITHTLLSTLLRAAQSGHVEEAPHKSCCFL